MEGCERGEPGDVGWIERVSIRGEIVQGGLDIQGLPQHDDVDDVQAVELAFLPDLVRELPEYPERAGRLNRSCVKERPV
jgi:hypothetical protein